MKTLLWMDLETTGLDFQEDVILEVASVVTDKNLNVISCLSMVVDQPSTHLYKMNDYVKELHTKSGLLEIINNGSGLHILKVDEMITDEVNKYFTEPVVLHGNSIHFDRNFINRYLPRLKVLLSYRMIDVSSFKECLKIYEIGGEPKKKTAHRALDDIYESISEYKYYLKLLNIIGE